MKRLFYITLAMLILPITNISAQQNVNLTPYTGTWKYTNPSTKEELTIKLRETTQQVPQIFGGHIEKCLVGIYIYKKNGQVIIDNSSQFTSNKSPLEMPIYAGSSADDGRIPNTLSLSIEDYGKMKNGRPKSSDGLLVLISSSTPKKIQWQIKERRGTFFEEDMPPLGFTIPTDAIFTKVE